MFDLHSWSVHQKLAAVCFGLSFSAVLGFMSMTPPAFTEARYALTVAAVSLLMVYVIWVSTVSNSIKTQVFYGLPLSFILVFGGAYGPKWIDDRENIYPRTPIYAGILRPDRLIDNGKINYVKIQIGKSHVFLESASVLDDVLKTWGKDEFTVEIKSGDMLVSTKIRDDDDNVIAELYKNEWKIKPPPGIWDRNYTNDTVEVIDARGDVVLQIHVLPGTIQIQGVWRITIGNQRLHLAIKEAPADVSPLGAQFVLCPVGARCSAIRPIFAYPSETHLGKLSQ